MLNSCGEDAFLGAGMMHFQTLGGVRASPITVLQLGDSVERSMHFALYDYAKGRGYSAREVEIPPDGPPDVIKGRSFYFLLADKMTMVSNFAGDRCACEHLLAMSTCFGKKHWADSYSVAAHGFLPWCTSN